MSTKFARRLVPALVLALPSVDADCPAAGSICERVDEGTCANACCRLTLEFTQVSTQLLATALNTTLAAGGPDGRYTLRPTAGDPNGFFDARNQGLPFDFLGQAHHLTASRVYTDSVDILITESDTEGSATLKAFSISLVGGAFTDLGQNYYNIVTLLDSLGLEYAEVANEGCPVPSANAAASRHVLAAQ